MYTNPDEVFVPRVAEGGEGLLVLDPEDGAGHEEEAEDERAEERVDEDHARVGGEVGIVSFSAGNASRARTGKAPINAPKGTATAVADQGCCRWWAVLK